MHDILFFGLFNLTGNVSQLDILRKELSISPKYVTFIVEFPQPKHVEIIDAKKKFFKIFIKINKIFSSIL
jgi:hypothetical protein